MYAVEYRQPYEHKETADAINGSPPKAAIDPSTEFASSPTISGGGSLSTEA
jgi:hypothetical protein